MTGVMKLGVTCVDAVLVTGPTAAHATHENER